MKFSIITAVYNNREQITRAMASLFEQDSAEVEYILIDGGSTDGTKELIESCKGKISHFVSEPDKGIYDALNKGLRLASGEVVGFLHSDDFYADPKVLRKVKNVFERELADGVYGDLQYVSATDPGRIIRHWKSSDFDRKLLRQGWMPPHPAFFVKRKWYTEYGQFDTRYTIAADYDLMLRFLLKENFRARYLPEVLVKMRVGGVSNRSLKTICKKSSEDLRIIRAHGLGGWGTLIRKNAGKIGQFF